MLRKAGLLLVEVDSDEVEADRRNATHVHQRIEQGVRVGTAGQADHHQIAVFDHRKLANRAAGQPADLLLGARR